MKLFCPFLALSGGMVTVTSAQGADCNYQEDCPNGMVCVSTTVASMGTYYDQYALPIFRNIF